ncbi:hypothetical protein AbraIFM66951_002732 [Aspergillus brasiliensis]|uniref:Methyltransferase domain-containing protein n=1 Tax=Aspergillus brasiliensis TaxID=319629 RepID=A0A9W6DSP1_9EURO|nr:hypothetical protein AbraCBS73388_004843 [Aspergillus brasiliensis]GKZ42799.1 hypothetical protein AbraIFM66951_002732 [Aspergillus brasiliensis]
MSDSDSLDHEMDGETESFDTEPHPDLYRHGRRYSLTHLREHPWPIDERKTDSRVREAFWIFGPALDAGQWNVRKDILLLRVPPNCEFWVDNLCEPGWHTQYAGIDLVHINQVRGDRQLLSLLLQGSSSCLTPGGWVEIWDMSVQLDDPGENSPFHRYIRKMTTAFARDGRQIDLPLQFGTALTEHGFTKVTEYNYNIPLCTEGCDELTEKIMQNWTAGLEGYSFTLLEKYLGKTFAETVLMCASARRALKGKIGGNLQMSVSAFHDSWHY